jgi:hydrogenase expression/formation protein HypC
MCLAIPGRVLDVLDRESDLVKVEIGGVRRDVNAALLDGALEPGDWVLIHVGFALSRIDEDEAQATLRLLEAMGAEYEQQLAELRDGTVA